MKSTYKLIGVFWDGRPEMTSGIAIRPYDPFYLALSSQPCLFDIVERKRRVELSRLLEIGSTEEAEMLIEEFAECTSVAVVLDYLPKAKSSVHRKFFEHRLLQVLGSLSELLPEAEIVLMEQRGAKAAA